MKAIVLTASLFGIMVASALLAAEASAGTTAQLPQVGCQQSTAPAAKDLAVQDAPQNTSSEPTTKQLAAPKHEPTTIKSSKLFARKSGGNDVQETRSNCANNMKQIALANTCN